jgi:Coenzyme PQQ synthesis protein D (PqqD)
MMPDTGRPLPEARREDIVVQELPDETLVYDLKRHKALCLNRAAGLVWKCCDGRTSVAEMAVLLERELQTPVAHEVVCFALERLDRARLLRERLILPSGVARLSRRELVQMGLAAAIAVPVILSVVAPRAAQAATCIALGKPCASNSQCCSHHCRAPVPGQSAVCVPS